MDFVEIVTGLLLSLSIIIVTVMTYLGLLGVLGIARFVRCEHCGHLSLSTREQPLDSCTYCHHGALWHPLMTLHRALEASSHWAQGRHSHGH